MWDRDPSNRILLPTHRGTKLEHDAEAATSVGPAHERDIDAISIFGIHPSIDAGSGVVIAVADAENRTPTATLAAAIAVDAFEDEFTEQTARLALGDGRWQLAMASALASAFAHANANVQRALGDVGTASGSGIALTAIVVCGDWSCVAHAGDGLAYRFSGRSLELLTADHELDRRHAAATLMPVCRPLGHAAAPAPVISFHRVRTGDLLLVCSHAIGQRLDVADITQLLGSRHSVADLARRLVSAAVARGSEGDLRAIVLRVGRQRGRRLPAPIYGLAAYDHGDVPLSMPRPLARGTRSAAPRRVGRVLALGLLVTGLGGAGWYWQTTVAAAASLQAVESMLQHQQLATRLPAPEQPEAPAEAAATLIVPTPAPPLASAPSDDSSDRLADERIRQRDRRAAALAEGRRLVALQQTQDSQAVANDARSRQLVLSAAATDAAVARAAAEKQSRDSTAALRESRAAAQAELERRATQRRAEQLAAAALADASAVSAAAAERLATETLANGQLALKTWLSGLVSQANAGNLTAPVLAIGPSSFETFVRKQHPTISEARLLTNSVTGTTGEATAQWLAKWRTSFGTGGSRRMQATASVVLENGSWRVRDWRITEGAP